MCILLCSQGKDKPCACHTFATQVFSLDWQVFHIVYIALAILFMYALQKNLYPWECITASVPQELNNFLKIIVRSILRHYSRQYSLNTKAIFLRQYSLDIQ